MGIEQRITAFDEDGNQYEVCKWVATHNVGTLSDPHASMPGLPSFKLSDGRNLNRIDEDTFEIVQSGQILRVK